MPADTAVARCVRLALPLMFAATLAGAGLGLPAVAAKTEAAPLDVSVNPAER